MNDDERRAMQREAYAAYVRLQWRLIRLPLHHPQRGALAAETDAANRYWRALASVPHNVGPITLGFGTRGTANRS